MEVPTVSAKDVRSSLSKKSPMPKKSLRKALLSPYETIRPICSDTTEIEEIMQRLLVHVKRESCNIPWPEFKLLSKEERKKAKEEKKMKNVEKSLRKQLVFGINEVMSSMEKHSLSSVIMSEDVVPSFLMNFVLDLATIHHVPILILPDLRKLTLEIMGFSSSCFGIKQGGANDDSFFYPLHQKIVEMAKEFEVPEHRILCQCPMESVESDDQQPLISEEKDSDSVLKAKSGWSCANPNGKSYWKLKKEKAKGKRVKKGEKQAGKESGMDTSSVSSDESMELGDWKESSKTLLVKASKRKSLAETINRKRRASHPYLRTFSLTGLKKRKSLHDPPESTIMSASVEHSKKKKRKNDTDGEGEEMEAVSTEVSSSPLERSEGFKYVMRNPAEKRHKKVDHFKPLRLTDG